MLSASSVALSIVFIKAEGPHLISFKKPRNYEKYIEKYAKQSCCTVYDAYP